ncbi:MAG: M6 family metalloprotease domain-containing protein, partial [Oscillospiraceae bacterium]
MKNMIKSLILTVAISVIGISAYAVPACPNSFTVDQPNGTELTLQLKGDEKFHYLVDTDGFVVEEKDNGYSYLLKENNGQVKLSSALATNNSRPQNAVRHDELVIPENNKYAIPDVAEPTGGNEQTNLLTILVEFTDQKLDARYNDSFWAGLMYDEGQNSVNKYYTEVSNGKRSVVFPNETSNIQNDGVVKVSLDIPHPEPEKALDDDEKETRIMSIVHKACAAANQYVDFSQYDKDKNKYITSDEMVISFVVAGFEASTRVVDKSVWAHQWSNCLPQDIICDGVNLLRNGTLGTKPINGTYIMQGELLSFSGNKTEHLKIGTLCHELGHALGLPDLYNTLTNETDPTPGIGCLSLMASGLWGANVGEVSGTTPSYLDAWCKVELGWIDPIVLDPNSSERYLSNAFASGDYNVYKIPTSDPKEYFLVENRQFTGFDKPIEKMFPSPG